MKEYKGYTATIEVADDVLHGEIIGIRDVVTFEADSIPELQRAFEDSVDDYLEFCALLVCIILFVPLRSFFPFPRQEETRRRCGAIGKGARRPEKPG